ncbi:hypothetical protein QYE76_056803 [Lolium multiflorum]|uniref:CCHC-type domain-containing protein n=1 Tax=Lolium multiflorum TaxID=4521 RepID=A0AAD8T2Y9_LOLMU|nr:hypothetical protein QYE76_056803 [Lolium multiflorum]
MRDSEAQRRREEEGRARERRGRDPRRPHPPPPQNLQGRDLGRAVPRPQGPTHGERVNLGRASTERGAPTTGETAHIVCYHCGKTGHIQAKCKDEPYCVKCNKVGHLSTMCASLSKAMEPFWAGYGVEGRGFTCCDVPDEELLPPAPNAALVILEGGDLSAEQMEEELKDLVDEEWEWRVIRLKLLPPLISLFGLLPRSTVVPPAPLAASTPLAPGAPPPPLRPNPPPPPHLRPKPPSCLPLPRFNRLAPPPPSPALMPLAKKLPPGKVEIFPSKTSPSCRLC